MNSSRFNNNILSHRYHDTIGSDPFNIGFSNPNRRRSGRLTKPSKKLQDYEVTLGKPLDNSSETSFGRERAWSNSSGYSGTSSSGSDDPEVLEAARILLMLKDRWQGYETPIVPFVPKKREVISPHTAPVINPNMRRSFEEVKYLTMDPEQAARRRKNTEAARYSRYQSRLREEQIEKKLDETEITNTDVKWRVASKKAYLRGLFASMGIDEVDIDAVEDLDDVKYAVDRNCALRGIRSPSLDDE